MPEDAQYVLQATVALQITASSAVVTRPDHAASTETLTKEVQSIQQTLESISGKLESNAPAQEVTAMKQQLAEVSQHVKQWTNQHVPSSLREGILDLIQSQVRNIEQRLGKIEKTRSPNTVGSGGLVFATAFDASSASAHLEIHDLREMLNALLASVIELQTKFADVTYQLDYHAERFAMSASNKQLVEMKNELAQEKAKREALEARTKAQDQQLQALQQKFDSLVQSPTTAPVASSRNESSCVIS